ncbi:hypothetical protein DRP53_07840 [candidate division WOR-3 bacterium]|uniref:FlgD/Vpr Ig-like domain-containing protein n=1 Tax=candidate division WOR-3 bacterium TaxID=2052148 RepID=A0A660SFI8_UNCW3|nr:MAG: hypothetical protein DRP53_07840 [candidate division WOR-3 bacterium]
MMIPLLSLFLFQGPDTLWTRTFGGTDYEIGRSLALNERGEIVVLGETGSFGAGKTDLYLLKVSADGETLWTRTYGGVGDDAGYSIQRTSDDCYIVVGATEDYYSINRDVYLLKIDEDGNLIWSRTYGGMGYEEGRSVWENVDRGYIIAGITTSSNPTSSDYDVYLIRTDSQGETLWTKTIDGHGRDEASSVQQTSDGGFIITGLTTSDEGDFDVYLIKTDSDGNILWTRTFGSFRDDGGRCVRQTFDGGYIIAGYLRSSLCWSRVYLIKTDANGDPIWTRFYNGYTDGGFSVVQTRDSCYTVVGGYYFDIYLSKVDSRGSILWSSRYSVADCWTVGLSLQPTEDNGYIIAGILIPFNSDNKNGQVYLIRTESEIGISEREGLGGFGLRLYPNPFRRRLWIELNRAPSKMRVRILDHTGRIIRTLELSSSPMVWDGCDDRGHPVPAGVYFLQLKSEEMSVTEKIVLLR